MYFWVLFFVDIWNDPLSLYYVELNLVKNAFYTSWLDTFLETSQLWSFFISRTELKASFPVTPEFDVLVLSSTDP